MFEGLRSAGPTDGTLEYVNRFFSAHMKGISIGGTFTWTTYIGSARVSIYNITENRIETEQKVFAAKSV